MHNDPTISDSEKMEPEYVRREYLSVSTLVSWVRCKRKYFYEKSGIRRGGVALNPEWGSGMHNAVPVALETEDLELACEEFNKYWVEIEERCAAIGMVDLKKHTRRTAERALSHFIHTHKDGKAIYKLIDPPELDLHVTPTKKVSKYEVPWVIDIGLRVPLGGRIDGLCTHTVTGEPWIWELKTTGRLNDGFFDAHEMYTQNLTYSLVGQTLDIPVEGVMLEAILCDAKKVDNETRMIPVMHHHIEDVLLWLQKEGQELLDAEDEYADRLRGIGSLSKPEDAFPKDFTGCTSYTHYYMATRFRCDYADLCRVPDWHDLVDLYDIVPDHKLFNLTELTVDPDAKRTDSEAK